MTTKLSEFEIKSRIKVVCICKGIKQGRICDLIKQGKSTVEEINKACGSGSGGCQGTRCRPVIEQLIERKGEPLATPHLQQEENFDEDDFFLK
jgi:bacterioferritin-associated ferredoxin